MSTTISRREGDSFVEGDFTKLEALVENLGKKLFVDVGILGAESDTESGLTLAGIGAVHEFGTDKAGRGRNIKIPARSFIRMPLETGQDQITESVESAGFEEKMAEGDVEGIFTGIGIAAEARIQEAFDTGGFGEWAPNAESTVERKGSDTPLIDDGTLRKAITSQVGGGS